MPSEGPNPKVRKINIEILLGVSAVVLSLAALFVSIFQTKIAREQQHASVWPYLQTVFSSGDKGFFWVLDNRGVGPAIVKKVECIYDSTSYVDPQQFVVSRFGYGTKGVGFTGIGPGSVLKAGDPINLIGVWENDSMARKIDAFITSKRFNLRLIYSDVYGNCWKLDDYKVTPLDECPE